MCPSKTISELSPFAFEIYRMAHETYRLSFRSLVRKIKIIAFVALVASMASIACGNEKVRQCVEYLNTSVKNTKEHKIKEETWRAFEKEKERLKNTETEKTQKNGKPFWRLGK